MKTCRSEWQVMHELKHTPMRSRRAPVRRTWWQRLWGRQ